MNNFKVNRLRSYCKINLFLNIFKKNKKLKLHEIQSLIFILSLYDEIKIVKTNTKKDIINFHGKFANQVKKKNNSVHNSIKLLRERGFIKNSDNFKISINKRIPAFSGLGGGSSNSATIVKFLSKKKLIKKELNFFSKKLGSDFRIFFYSSKIFQKNLKTFVRIKSPQKFYFLLIYPFLKCSTKLIYSKVNSFNQIEKDTNFNINSKNKFISSLKNKSNALEKIALDKYPKLKRILKEIEKINNCEFSRITGSGSGCFGLFLTKKSANLGLKKIKKKFPKYWCVVCKTI